MRPLERFAPSLRRWAIGLLAAGLAGCIAPDVDPADDLRQASDLVAERSGWTPSWNAPWADDATSWDGCSPLTVRQAVTIALQNNRELRVELEGIAGARADLAQSGLLPNPVLGASFGTNDTGDVTDFSLVQELTQLWLRPAQQDAAAAALQGQIQGASDHAVRLAADVRIGHARVVFGQRGVALTASLLQLVGRATDVAQARLEAGEGTQLDVNRLREEQLSTQADLDSQRTELETAKRELLGQLGLAAAGADWQAADEAGRPDARLASLTEADAVARASVLRLDVAAARTTVEQRQAELHAASLGRIPGVSAGYDYGKDEEDLRTRGPELELEIPIFDTGSVAVAKAESDLRAAVAAADQVLQAAVQQTRSAFLALQSSLHLAALYQEQVVSLAQQNLDEAQQSYDAGEADVTVVLDTQRELAEAQTKLNDLQLDVATSAAELEYVVGGRL